MLSRVLARSVQTPRLGASPAALRIASSSQLWRRSMAKNHKPNHGQNKPSSNGRQSGNNQPSKPVAAGAAATGAFTQQGSQANSKLGKSEFSKKQEEISGNASPKSQGTGAGSVNAASRKGEDPAFSRKQEEFNTTASPSENTAPQSSSPSAIDPAEAQAQAEAQTGSLPDLTKGIPSTWEFEVAQRRKASSSPLNLTEAQGGGGKGKLPDSAYVSSAERNRNKRFSYLYLFFGFAGASGTLFLGRNWETPELESEHPDVPNGMTPGLMWARAKARYNDLFDYYQKPTFQKLLPDVDPSFARDYTLVVSLEDLLIKAEWSREHGWRIAKRPGVDYFLRYLSLYYEIVIFTSQPWMIADPVIKKLDPFRIATWQLFREATLYKPEENTYVKDLAYLNRDLSKVIIMDTKASHVQNQPENAIVLKPWEGNADDKELVSYIPFLEYLPTMAYSDVRKALKSFEGKDIPTEFAAREAIARQKFHEELKSRKAPRGSGTSFLSNALGIKAGGMMERDPNEQSTSEAFAQGKMLQDVARERGQRAYAALDKEIRENGEKWLKEEADAMKKQEEEGMKAMKSGFLGFLGTGNSGA
ncbi:Mitochondrial import inner membrane translocase subunit [Lachnellula subtilissima]|uniref:Mitochondrial import inner membrane translocase subunit TIM50 n=1 Tax=Lachnellula subtilissima TaxID=602034 RepID=A0A8H8RM37_9HELO|nr:Mitochondrial import inner membrane translocase subunit [Lachnellula subtilissima]